MTLSRRARTWVPVAFLVVVVLVCLVALLALGRLRPELPGSRGALPPRSASSSVAWPSSGQAAYLVAGTDHIITSGNQDAVPIASVTKVMTALIVLERAPLPPGSEGFTLTITSADVADTARRRARSESVVPVVEGEVVTEREALLGLLLPSANNMAHLLAEEVAGSERRFVRLMNARAEQLGLTRTHYADASGFSASSRSTAYDQTVLVDHAMRNAVFSGLVGRPSARLPSAGEVLNTDRLLGADGYVGVKTGSTTPAGGCFAFAAYRRVGGEERLIVGAVTGQRGPDLVAAAFSATQTMVDSVSDS